MNNTAKSYPSGHTVVIHLDVSHLAVLVGLKNIRAMVDKIICLDPPSKIGFGALRMIELWLEKNHFPKLTYAQPGEQTKTINCSQILRSWGWGSNECRAVVKLEGLPLSLDLKTNFLS